MAEESSGERMWSDGESVFRVATVGVRMFAGFLDWIFTLGVAAILGAILATVYNACSRRMGCFLLVCYGHCRHCRPHRAGDYGCAPRRKAGLYGVASAGEKRRRAYDWLATSCS